MKKLLFVSDIQGTIDGATIEELNALGEKLNLLKESHGALEVVFSLSTGDADVRYVSSEIKKIESVFCDYGITMGTQFFNGGMINNGIVSRDNSNRTKVEKFLEYIDEINTTDEVVAVYYADDRAQDDAKNGYVEYKLGKTIPYCLIEVSSNRNFNCDILSSSTDRNIQGVLKSLDFHLGISSAEEANINYWNNKRLEEERRLKIAVDQMKKVSTEAVVLSKQIEQDKIIEKESLEEKKRLELEAKIAKEAE